MLYNESLITDITKKIKKERIMLYSTLATFIIITIIAFIVMDENHQIAYKWLLSIVDVLLAFGMIILIFYYILRNKRLLKHYKLVIYSKGKSCLATFTKISKELLTLANNDEVYQIDAIENKNKKVFYLLYEFDVEDLKENTEYDLVIVNNFVKEYKEHEL